MARTQFSLRTLLAAVAAVGIGAALWTAEPSWRVGAAELFLAPSVIALAAMIAVRSTGTAKVFWRGFAAQCFLPAFVYILAALLFSLADNMNSEDTTGSLSLDSLFPFSAILFDLAKGFRFVVLTWTLAPIAGLLCVLTHWLFIRSADPAEPKD